MITNQSRMIGDHPTRTNNPEYRNERANAKRTGAKRLLGTGEGGGTLIIDHE
jgi:hypothetical protein